MTEFETLMQWIAGIQPLNRDAMDAAEKRQAQLAKPPGSLGTLEDLSVQFAGITGQVHNRFPKKCLLVFASDNGVVAEGVASTPQSVTLMQTINLTRSKTGAATLAKHVGCDVRVFDMGVNAEIRDPAVHNRKIAYGTKNLAQEPAMTREQAIHALLVGLQEAHAAAADGYSAIGIGEMGIGNTTTSSAVLAVLTGTPVRQVTGRGAGITDEGYEKKCRVIQTAIDRDHPDPADPIDILTKVGGYDLAAMAGAFLGAASAGIPVVIDGFISVVAALCAARLCPEAKHYMIASHASYEIGYQIAVRELELQPMLNLGMRLGEGSGCPLAFQIMDAACAIINDMATFDEAEIDDGYLDEIRTIDAFTVEAEA